MTASDIISLLEYVYFSVVDRVRIPKTQSMPMKFTREIKFNLMFYRVRGCVCASVHSNYAAVRRGAGAAPVVLPRPARLYTNLSYTWELTAGHSVKDSPRVRFRLGNIIQYLELLFTL